MCGPPNVRESRRSRPSSGDLASAPSFPNHHKPWEIQRLGIPVFHNSSLSIMFYFETSQIFAGPHINTTVASSCTKPYKIQWWGKRWTPGGKGVTTLTDSASHDKHPAQQRGFSKCSQFPKSPQTIGNTASGDTCVPQFVVIDRVLFRGVANIWWTTQKYHRGVQLHETL